MQMPMFEALVSGYLSNARSFLKKDGTAHLALSRKLESYEFHGDTLTETLRSTRDLLAATDHTFIKTPWQPPHGRLLEKCLNGLRTLGVDADILLEFVVGDSRMPLPTMPRASMNFCGSLHEPCDNFVTIRFFLGAGPRRGQFRDS